jgi:hypothetical protein
MRKTECGLAKSITQAAKAHLSSPFESLLSPHIMALSIAEAALNLLNNKGKHMSYSTFRLGANDATKEPMFLGNSVNVSRYDIQNTVNLKS